MTREKVREIDTEIRRSLDVIVADNLNLQGQYEQIGRWHKDVADEVRKLKRSNAALRGIIKRLKS